MTESLALIVLLFAPHEFSSDIGVRPPPAMVDELFSPPSKALKYDPLKSVRAGKLKFRYEETTLAQIQEIFGAGSIEHEGDAAASQYWLCYSTPQSRVWFISHGEMGGPEHQLTGVHAVLTDSMPIGEKTACPPVPVRHLPVVFSFGWVGMRSKDLFKVLGKPPAKHGRRFAYNYWGKKHFFSQYRKETFEYDISAYIEVDIENDRVISISAHHTTSM